MVRSGSCGSLLPADLQSLTLELIATAAEPHGGIFGARCISARDGEFETAASNFCVSVVLQYNIKDTMVLAKLWR